MTEQEKVKAGLTACEWLIQTRDYCKKNSCPYLGRRNGGECLKAMHRDALELLEMLGRMEDDGK